MESAIPVIPPDDNDTDEVESGVLLRLKGL
jgi:hypothetical protein